MTEQELKQKIDESDRQIVDAYSSLRLAAREVGVRGCQAAQRARSSVVSEVSGEKTKKTLLPLLISLVGLFIFGVAWFLGLIMLVAGIGIAYDLNQKADAELDQIRSAHNSMVSLAEEKQRELESVLDRNKII